MAEAPLLDIEEEVRSLQLDSAALEINGVIDTEDARPEEVEKVDEMEKGWWYSEIHSWNFVLGSMDWSGSNMLFILVPDLLLTVVDHRAPLPENLSSLPWNT
ncbi:hypothetical protein OIU85_003370 [Salix viminalis]|uniref:Uncharacterized protein n=1 Tax=Salix viminalis TaxID=40686 RepID=A0A9Q0PZ10_SALVM|nr:hypothetical protein OIU85_003370 [Salix viminalis]